MYRRQTIELMGCLFQNEDLIEHNVPEATAPTPINPKRLKYMVKELNKLNPYKTTSNGDPAIRDFQ